MSVPDQPTVPHQPDDKAQVERMVATCIEALERGEPDPATRVCGERPDLLARVRRRLAQLAQRGLIPAQAELPTSIGPYRIQRELGSGGMGSVYLAQQLEPVQRQVALKVVKLGMDTREVVARFQSERQALAQMNHPNIAQVFDAGITAEGRPFFVMEYVSGNALTAFCDERQLPIEQRVRLMAVVCRAVQHAHDRGFIHRDLKPGNVLVTAHEGEFTPKVIDFGIAKATAVAEQAATRVAGLQTRADQVLGTPEYMSPEQMRSGGLDVDTRSDVYSLGVTLYELLCGELPFDSRRLRTVPRAELERILFDEPPTQPSKRLSQIDVDAVAARGVERSVVTRAVAGELDWITLRALAKLPQHRYPSALAMAEDLERWLMHEPVLAAPPGHTYRLRKFVRRHRVGVGAAAAVLVALIGGLSMSLLATAEARAAQQAERTAREAMAVFYGLARDAVGNLVDVADRELAEVPQADAVRRRMLADAIRYYETLRSRDAADPALRADLVDATVRIGTLQRRLGQTDDARDSLQRCVVDAESLLVDFPGQMRPLRLAIAAHSQLAAMFTAVGGSDAAERGFARALELVSLARAVPGAELAELDVIEASLCANLAMELDDDTPKALVFHERALAVLDRSVPRNATLERDRARIAAGYAETLTRAGRRVDAAAALKSAAQRLQSLPADASAKVREAEALLQSKLAHVLARLDRKPEAVAAQQRAIALHHTLAAEHPDVPSHADDEAGGWHQLAQLHEDAADVPAALAALGQGLVIREQLVAKAPQNHRFGMRYARSLLLLADLQIQSMQKLGGDREAPTATLARAGELVDALLARHGDDVDVVLTFGAVHGAIGAFATTEQRFADAVREHTAVQQGTAALLGRFDTNADVHYQLAITANNLLQAHFMNGDAATALAAGEAGLPYLLRGLALDARHRALLDLAATLHCRVAMVRLQTGDRDGGVALLQQMARSELGADVREQGCLLLGNTVDDNAAHEQHAAWQARLLEDLAAVIAARGELAAALARPPQATGFSHVGSRLRDLDLRLAFANQLGRAERHDEQARWLDEAAQIAAASPSLTPDRTRNLVAQQAELALAQQDSAAAIAGLERHLAAVGDAGGSNYLVAVLFARARGLLDAGAERQRIDAAVVQRLRLAVEHGEVRREAVRHPNFAFLRGRHDYAALLEQ